MSGYSDPSGTGGPRRMLGLYRIPADTSLLLRLLAMLLLFCSFQATATSSLSFSGGGYSIYMEIGHQDRPVVSSVKFHRPGDAKGVLLRGNFEVEEFDVEQKVLVLIYKGLDPGIQPFKLVVRNERAVLHVGAKQVHSEFSWFM